MSDTVTLFPASPLDPVTRDTLLAAAAAGHKLNRPALSSGGQRTVVFASTPATTGAPREVLVHIAPDGTLSLTEAGERAYRPSGSIGVEGAIARVNAGQHARRDMAALYDAGYLAYIVTKAGGDAGLKPLPGAKK